MTTWFLIMFSASTAYLDGGEYSSYARCVNSGKMQVQHFKKQYGPALRFRCVSHTGDTDGR